MNILTRLRAAWQQLRSEVAPEWRRHLEVTLARRFGLATAQDRRFLVLIGLTGVLVGLLGVAIHRLIDALKDLLWGPTSDFIEATQTLPWWQVVLLPGVGGAVVGAIVLLGRQRVSGQGMGVLIEAVAVRGGRVPVRPIVWGALAAIATVGSGGSLGREGPMIRLGAMLSSQLGAYLGLDSHRIKILVGCGAAGGLAAAYNIPIGGALFAMEVILGNFALEIFGPIVTSSVLATLLARFFQGDAPFYQVKAGAVVGGWELLGFAGLGVVGAVFSIAFVFGARGCARLFRAARPVLPPALQPVVGMMLLGTLALSYPQVLGGGVQTINAVLQGKFDLLRGGWHLPMVSILLLLALAKLLAVGLTAGSGCAGGMFTPSMCFGALIGSAYGLMVHERWPELTSAPAVYALVGMAAIAAGTSHAPISAVLIVFEFTGDYDFALPLMVACLPASLLSRSFYPYSIYTQSLQKKGIDLSWRMEEAVLAGLRVCDLQRQDREVLQPADNYKTVVERFLASRRQRLFVVDDLGRLVGVVSLHDIKHLLDQPENLAHIVAYDILSPVTQVLDYNGRLHRAAETFAHSDFERLPVVDPKTGRFTGILTKRDLLAVYAQEVLGRPGMLATFVPQQDRTSRDYVELPPDFALRLVPVPDSLVGQTLVQACLPQRFGLRVIELLRPAPGGPERQIPDRDTTLLEGDELILLGPRENLEAFIAGAPQAPEAGKESPDG